MNKFVIDGKKLKTIDRGKHAFDILYFTVMQTFAVLSMASLYDWKAKRGSIII